MATRKPKATEPPPQNAVVIPALNIKRISLVIIGDAPLIVHAWSKKAKTQMLAKQMKKAKTAKETRDPEQDYLDSMYVLPDGGYGFPSIGFKAAAVDACSHVDGVTKVVARGAFHIDSELVRILGEPSMREDMVRLNGLSADIRYRAQFEPWRAVLEIRYNANVLSAEQIANLFNVAGFAIGVGEWRPQRDGMKGLFHVGGKGE